MAFRRNPYWDQHRDPNTLYPIGSPMARSSSAVPLSRGSSAVYSNDPRRPFSPVGNRDDQSVEMRRLTKYRLNVPESWDENEVRRQQRNKESPFYATDTVKEVRHEQLLPYKTETVREQYRYLCHIVTHIYIAIRSEDLKGNISIGVADLDKAREALMKEQSVDDFIKQERENSRESEVDTTDGQAQGDQFETLMRIQSEADEDDEEENSSDSFYESDYSSDDGENVFASTPVSKVQIRSASVIGLKYWTKELKNLLTIGLAIPGTLCAALIKVYYAVVLSRGQSIDVGFYTNVVAALAKEKDLLRDTVGLRLDWQPLYKEMLAQMPFPNASSGAPDEVRFKKMVRFSLAVNSFFPDDCVPDIMKAIFGNYSNKVVSETFIQMAVMLPQVFLEPETLDDGTVRYSPKDIRYYLPAFFSCWTSQRSNKEIACLVSVIANIAQAQLTNGSKNPATVVMGPYGVFTKQQFAFIANQLVSSSDTPQKDSQARYVKLLVDIVVHSLTSKYAGVSGGVLDLMRTFITSIRVKVHPSNSGGWSDTLSRVVKRFCTSYHRRLLQEEYDRTLVPKHADDYSGLSPHYKLSKELTRTFVDSITPVILLGVQSKQHTERRRYVKSLEVLCFMSPTQILDSVLLDIYSSFETVNSTHRIEVVLAELTALARYMAQLPVYRVHLPRLLMMLVPGVDSNDPDKTIMTISLVKLVAMVVPFVDLNEGESGDSGLLAEQFTTQHLNFLQAEFYESSPNENEFSIDGTVPDHFEYEPQLELEALRSVTSIFPEFVAQFCERCFKYLEFSPNVEGDGGIESQASVLISHAMDALIESLSDSLYTIVADKFFEYITNNVQHLVALVFSNIAELIIRRDPQAQLPRFFNFLMGQIHREIAEGAGTSRTQEVLGKDARLIWYLKLLCGTCLGGGKYLVPYLPKLQHFLITETGMLKGEASYAISLVANSMFAAVSCTRPTERRLISQDWLAHHGGKVTEACWGGFQFDKYRFDPANLQFAWYRPSAAEIDPLIETFEAVCESSVEVLADFLEVFNPSEKIPLDTVDILSYHINVLDGAVTGICTLFDPDFKPHMLEPARVLSGRANSSRANSGYGLSMTSAAASSVSLASMGRSFSTESSLAAASGASGSKMGSRLNSPSPAPNNDSSKYHSEEHQGDGEAVDEPRAPSTIDDYVVPDSEFPSGAATPSGMGEGLESIDASLTDRSPNLYTFGYYFDGNAFTKLSDPSYVRLHKTREKIGHVLHDLVTALMKHDGAIELMQSVIGAINGWLKNCGYFSSNNPLFIDNFHFATVLDGTAVNEPYTRVVYGARAAIYHCNRMNNSRCTRLPTETDKLLIRDLVTLAAGSYNVTAYTASSVLTSALSKIMNCTHLVFRILDEWESALTNKDEDRLKNILRLFALRKFRGLAEKNSHYLRKYEDLLVRTIGGVDEAQTTSLALKLYGSIKKYVRIPARVCLMDQELVECIRPPDTDVEGQVRVLKMAKATKKQLYFEMIAKLVKRTIKRTHETKHVYWKYLLKSLELVASLHSHMEIPLNGDVLKLLAKNVNGVHPRISKSCVIWIAWILDLVSAQGFYNYDLERMMSWPPDEPGVKPLSSVLDSPDADKFFAETKRFGSKCSFFMDNKYWVPTLSWNNDILVVDAAYERKKLGFNETDERSIRRFGKLVTRKWLLAILELHIEESESKTKFLSGMAYFLSYLATLALHDYTPNLKYWDLFDIVDELYERDDKATHLVAVEMYTGILLACRIDGKKYLKETDERIAKKVGSVLQHDVTQATLNIWKIFCWWVPGHVDMRRCPQLVHAICDFDLKDTSQSSPFNTFSRVSLLKSYVSSNLNRYHDFDGLIERLFPALSDQYQLVSDKVATALFEALLYTSTKSFPNFEAFMEANLAEKDGMGIYPYKMTPAFDKAFRQFLQEIKELRPSVEGKSPQAIADSEYMYHIRGLQFLLSSILQTHHGDLLFPYLISDIVPILFDLDTMKDACTLMSISPLAMLCMLASIRFRNSETPAVVDFLCSDAQLVNPSSTQTIMLVAFTQAYYMMRFLTVSPAQKKRLQEQDVKFLYSKHLDVREVAARYFPMVVLSILDSNSDELIEGFVKRFVKVVKKARRDQKHGNKLAPEQVAQLHGATLGLGALVEAFPYNTPPPKWLPKVLSVLALKCSSFDGLEGRTAKEILSRFKKTRQDTWHIDSKFFSKEQLEDLEGVLWKSYFI